MTFDRAGFASYHNVTKYRDISQDIDPSLKSVTERANYKMILKLNISKKVGKLNFCSDLCLLLANCHSFYNVVGHIDEVMMSLDISWYAFNNFREQRLNGRRVFSVEFQDSSNAGYPSEIYLHAYISPVAKIRFCFGKSIRTYT